MRRRREPELTARIVRSAWVLGAAGVAAAIAACTAAENDSVDAWVGTIATEGSVTTVVNESGSVWGGAATLVEELSIGVDAGADEYMFGFINALAATDEHVFVLDSQVPAVRMFDRDGAFVRNLGAEGQGPGEYTSPSLIAVDAGGLVYVLDSRLSRINVYDARSGENLDPWPMPSSRCCAWPMYTLTGEAVWAPVQEWVGEERRERRYGVQAIGAHGPYGEVIWIPEIEYQRSTFPVGDGFDAVTPFSAWLLWNPAPHGRLLVGASDRYRFELHGTDGSTLVVERPYDPIPVPVEHGDWERQRTLAFHRGVNNPDATWDGSGMPDHKAAYGALIPALSGETWVVRSGASVRLTDCAEDPIGEGHPAGYERPCWSEEMTVDAFGADGRYLGEVEAPDGLRWDSLTLVVDDDTVHAVVQDDAGVVRVKRYRLVVPDGPRQ